MTTFTSTSSALVASTFSSRNQVSIYNEGAGDLYILVHDNPDTDATASASNYTLKIASGILYETPRGTIGKIYCIFASAGTARVTQIAQLN